MHGRSLRVMTRRGSRAKATNRSNSLRVRFTALSPTVTSRRPRSMASPLDVRSLASGEVFADALAAGPLAGTMYDPILLTGATELPKETAAALERLEPDRIVVLGGETRISFGVLNAAEAYSPDVTRLAGADRYETAALIAARLTVGIPDSKRTFIASGLNFPDALGGSVLAGTEHAPLLLNRGDQLIDATAQALLDRNPVTVTLLGGPSAVGEDIVVEVHRLLRLRSLVATGDVSFHAWVDLELPRSRPQVTAAGRAAEEYGG